MKDDLSIRVAFNSEVIENMYEDVIALIEDEGVKRKVEVLVGRMARAASHYKAQLSSMREDKVKEVLFGNILERKLKEMLYQEYVDNDYTID